MKHKLIWILAAVVIAALAVWLLAASRHDRAADSEPGDTSPTVESSEPEASALPEESTAAPLPTVVPAAAASPVITEAPSETETVLEAEAPIEEEAAVQIQSPAVKPNTSGTNAFGVGISNDSNETPVMLIK